jgi:hypothetical protein
MLAFVSAHSWRLTLSGNGAHLRERMAALQAGGDETFGRRHREERASCDSCKALICFIRTAPPQTGLYLPLRLPWHRIHQHLRHDSGSHEHNPGLCPFSARGSEWASVREVEIRWMWIKTVLGGK